MLVLHDPITLKHKTTELLGSKILQALECPERLLSILTTLQDDPDHEIQIKSLDDGSTQSDLLHKLITSSHQSDYLEHLRTAHENWLSRDLVEKDGTVLP